MKYPILTLVAFFLSFNSFSQIQLGNAILGDSAHRLGSSIALSGDGKILVISSPRFQDTIKGMGMVNVYQYNGQGWEQLGDTIKGELQSEGSYSSVSVSDNGHVIAIGAPLALQDGIRAGRVRVLEYKSGNWQLIGRPIYGQNYGDAAGHSISLSAEGKTIAIGTPGRDGIKYGSGSVRVFQYDSSYWKQLGNEILGDSADLRVGEQVKLSANGKTLAIGIPRSTIHGKNSGQVQIFEYKEDLWVQKGKNIDGLKAHDERGISLSISADGNMIAIGSIGHDAPDKKYNSGSVAVYKFDAGSWSQIGNDIEGESAYDHNGFSVSLSSDGTVVAMGSIENDDNGRNAGHARVFQFNRGQWEQIGEDVDGEKAGDTFGHLVSLSNDGSTLAIAAPWNDENGESSGMVKVYEYKIPLKIEKPVERSQFVVYPNPVNKVLNVDINQSMLLQEYQVFDAVGKVMIQGNLSSLSNQIDLHDLTNGVYWIRIEGSRSYIFKIIKQ